MGPAKSVSDEGKSYQLSLQLSRGDRLVYSFSQTTETSDPSADTPSKVTEQVRAELVEKCVFADQGLYRLETSFRNVDVSVSAEGSFKESAEKLEEERRAALQKPGELILDKRYQTPGAQPAAPSVSLPGGKIKIGDTWEAKVAEAADDKDPAAQFRKMMPTFKCRFAGIDEINGRKCARVEATLSSTGMAEMKEPAKTWFDLESGVIVRSIMEMKIASRPLISFRLEMDLKEFERAK